MPQVSIITPTINRQNLLPALWDCVRAQTVQDFEWLIHDGSPQRATIFDEPNQDRRIRYLHAPSGHATIGAKRNELCDAAQGEIIAHFDDDDFYGAHYIQRMVSLMTERNADFVKPFGYFLYHRRHDAFAYWDLEHDFPLHYVLHPTDDITFAAYRGGADARWGYGFSYVFDRRVWETVRFPDQNHGEDHVFANAAVARFKSAGQQDLDCSCIHVIHSSNTSFAYPQQILDRRLLQQLFPGFPQGPQPSP